MHSRFGTTTWTRQKLEGWTPQRVTRGRGAVNPETKPPRRRVLGANRRYMRISSATAGTNQEQTKATRLDIALPWLPCRALTERLSQFELARSSRGFQSAPRRQEVQQRLLAGLRRNADSFAG